MTPNKKDVKYSYNIFRLNKKSVFYFLCKKLYGEGNMSDMDDLRDLGVRVDGDFDYDWFTGEGLSPNDEVASKNHYAEEYIINTHQTAQYIVDDIMEKNKSNNLAITGLLLQIDSELQSKVEDKYIYNYFINVYYMNNKSNTRIKVIEEVNEKNSLPECMDIIDAMISDIKDRMRITNIQRVYKKNNEIQPLIKKITNNRNQRFKELRKKTLIEYPTEKKEIYFFKGQVPF
jgi:hypothetical protein